MSETIDFETWIIVVVCIIGVQAVISGLEFGHFILRFGWFPRRVVFPPQTEPKPAPEPEPEPGPSTDPESEPLRPRAESLAGSVADSEV